MSKQQQQEEISGNLLKMLMDQADDLEPVHLGLLAGEAAARLDLVERLKRALGEDTGTFPRPDIAVSGVISSHVRSTITRPAIGSAVSQWSCDACRARSERGVPRVLCLAASRDQPTFFLKAHPPDPCVASPSFPSLPQILIRLRGLYIHPQCFFFRPPSAALGIRFVPPPHIYIHPTLKIQRSNLGPLCT